jgi:hypothetical protein
MAQECLGVISKSAKRERLIAVTEGRTNHYFDAFYFHVFKQKPIPFMQIMFEMVESQLKEMLKANLSSLVAPLQADTIKAFKKYSKTNARNIAGFAVGELYVFKAGSKVYFYDQLPFN